MEGNSGEGGCRGRGQEYEGRWTGAGGTVEKKAGSRRKRCAPRYPSTRPTKALSGDGMDEVARCHRRLNIPSLSLSLSAGGGLLSLCSADPYGLLIYHSVTGWEESRSLPITDNNCL